MQLRDENDANKDFNKRRTKILSIILSSLLLISAVAGAENIHLQVKGLSGSLEENVRAQLSYILNSEFISDRHFQTHIKDSIRKALRALGYYEPTINFNLHSLTTKSKQMLVISVNPGKPVYIGGVNIAIQGEASTDQDYLNLLSKCPSVGSVVNHKDYDDFKKNLTNIALRKGYFDSYFKKSQLGIELTKHKAFWDIDYDSGPRYRFGSVVFEGSQILNKYIENLIPFKKGDFYESKDLAELNRRLSSTGWFSSIIIIPKFNQSHESKVLPLHGIVSPRVKNTVETGIGYSTDAGLHVKILVNKPWTNSHGHSFTTSTSISESEQLLDFSYKVPSVKNPIEQYYLVQGRFKRANFNNTQSDSTTLIMSRYWDLSNGWQQIINLCWSLDHLIQAGITNATTLLYASVVISYARSCDVALTPTWNNSQQYSIDYSNSAWGSNIDFIIIQAKNTWIRTLFNRHRLIIHNHLGWIETSDFRKMTPDLRFFAGGDHSIRGYKYKSISPKDEKGKITGGSKLIINSLEYQYSVTRKWWGSLFIDSGEAISNIRHSDFKIGTGVGVRWKSPVGTIKLDCAMPIGNKEKHSLEFYIGLGPE